MRAVRAVLLLLPLLAVALKPEHVVVLMMENRSFDHVLGFLKAQNPEIDGVDGTEYNHLDASDPSSPKYCVNANARDVVPDDPGHSLNFTSEQIYGFRKPHNQKAVPKMNGFVQNAKSLNHKLDNPISCYHPGSAPVLNFLATEYVVFDRWFSSVPGPTDPNRAIFMAGTSKGYITNFDLKLWGQQSYFDFLGKNNVTWNAFYQDDPWAFAYFADMVLSSNIEKLQPIDRFYEQLEKGTLPKYVMLQPRMTPKKGPPTWQHPTASMSEGERLIQRIYDALRASRYWSKVAFLITYDEHGGFYDHVAPPQEGIAHPDGIDSPDGFQFDRLGPRVPTVLVSPLVPKGLVVHGPSQPGRHFDHASMIATVNKLFGLQNPSKFGQRVAQAGTFEDVFDKLQAPREDCPVTTPSPPTEPWTAQRLQAHRQMEATDHTQIQVDYYCKFNNLGYPDKCNHSMFPKEGEAGDFIVEQAEKFMADRLRAVSSSSTA